MNIYKRVNAWVDNSDISPRKPRSRQWWWRIIDLMSTCELIAPNASKSSYIRQVSMFRYIGSLIDFLSTHLKHASSYTVSKWRKERGGKGKEERREMTFSLVIQRQTPWSKITQLIHLSAVLHKNVHITYSRIAWAFPWTFKVVTVVGGWSFDPNHTDRAHRAPQYHRTLRQRMGR